MATLVFPIYSYDNGTIKAEMEIDDSNWNVSKFRIINNSIDKGIELFVRKSGLVIFYQLVPAGETQSWNTTGIQLGWQLNYWDSITETWESDGIDMYDYTIQVRTV